MTTNRFTEAARRARMITNAQLADQINDRLTISEEEIQALLPEPQDRAEFKALITSIQQETSVDLKLTKIRDNFTTAGKVALGLIKTMI